MKVLSPALQWGRTFKEASHSTITLPRLPTQLLCVPYYRSHCWLQVEYFLQMKIKLPSPKKTRTSHYTYSSPPLPPTPVKRPPFSKCSPFWPFSVFSVTAYGVNRRKYRRLPRYACIPQKAKMGGELNWACMRLGQSCIELHYGTVLGHSRFFCWLLETFRFCDENDYDYDIFSILSIAHAWTSVVGAGKRDSRRHSTSSISENVVEAGRNYQM